MSALPWVKLDTGFPSNPKILALVEDGHWRAALVWLCSLAYSGAHGTDGYLPKICLPWIHATEAEAAILVEVGLWKIAPGGWEINDWREHQVSNSETASRSEHARRAAMARWHKNGAANAGDAHADAHADAASICGEHMQEDAEFADAQTHARTEQNRILTENRALYSPLEKTSGLSNAREEKPREPKPVTSRRHAKGAGT